MLLGHMPNADVKVFADTEQRKVGGRQMCIGPRCMGVRCQAPVVVKVCRHGTAQGGWQTGMYLAVYGQAQKWWRGPKGPQWFELWEPGPSNGVSSVL